MDLAFDHLRLDSAGFPRRFVAPTGESQLVGAPDWRSLKARFLAAHALRRELALACAAEPAGGSFRNESAPVLAAGRGSASDVICNSSQAVNPTASANSKPLGAIEDYIVGNPDPASEEVYD